MTESENGSIALRDALRQSCCIDNSFEKRFRAGMLLIRSERSDDVSSIRELLAECFPTTAEADLVDRLRAARRLLISLVAECDDAVVGHVAMSPVTVADGRSGAGLAPVAVLPGFQRQGIGRKLVDAALATCRDAHLGWAVVLGEPDYYARFGFVPASRSGLSDEYGGGEAFQAVELVPGSLPVGAGQVRYAPEFAVFE